MSDVATLKTMVFYDMPYILSMPVVFMLIFIVGTFYFNRVARKRLEGAFIIFLALFLIWIVSTARVTCMYVDMPVFWHYLAMIILYLMPLPANLVLYEVLEPEHRPFVRRIIGVFAVLALGAYGLELAGLEGLARGQVIYYPLTVVAELSIFRLLLQSSRKGNTYSRAAMLPCLGLALLVGLDGICGHWQFFPWHTFLLPIGVYSLVFFALLLLREQLLCEQALKLHAFGLEEEIRIAQERTDEDELTGCKSRRAFDKKIAGLMHPEAGEPLPFALLMLDIDHFKSVNDTYGHDTGDEVLVRFTEAVRQAIVTPEWLFRWGGEEFIVLCPGHSLSQAAMLAERIRREVAAADILARQPVTVSIGCAVWHGRGDPPEAMFERMDEALYRAKNKGRNRVEAEKV